MVQAGLEPATQISAETALALSYWTLHAPRAVHLVQETTNRRNLRSRGQSQNTLLYYKVFNNPNASR